MNSWFWVDSVFEHQSLDFDSSDQLLDQKPRNLKGYLIQNWLLRFVVGHYSFLFLLFLFFPILCSKFLFFFLEIDLSTKSNITFGIVALWDFCSEWVIWICFHITKKSDKPLRIWYQLKFWSLLSISVAR